MPGRRYALGQGQGQGPGALVEELFYLCRSTVTLDDHIPILLARVFANLPAFGLFYPSSQLTALLRMSTARQAAHA